MEQLVSRSLAIACILTALAVGCHGTAAWGSDRKQKVKAAAFTHHEADVNGIRLHYVTAGKGKLILFVHGFPEFWYAWKHQFTEFGKDFQAVALDMRGYNLSSKPADVSQYELKYLVEDVRALADHLGQKRFVLVGHDWGGVVAWLFAAAHPDYLEKLVIINAPHPAVFQRELRENPAQQKASQYMLLFRSPAAEATLSANHYAALVEGVLGEGLKKGYFTEEDRKAYLDAWSQPGARVGPPTAAGDPAPVSGEGARPEAPAIAGTPDVPLVVKVPTLVIWGEKDQALLTGNLEGLDAFVPKLTIKRIPDGSHWVVHEQPARINTLVREFITGRPAP
jgi:epoxide hydrolase 4